MKINDAGLALIKRFEGLRLTAYKDQGGVLTIGYGHTGNDVFEGQEISQETADSLLIEDLETAEAGVTNSISVPLTENQFSALVSFAYNLGVHTLKVSTLGKMINAGDFEGARQQFVRWDLCGGRVVTGLLNRRMAEAELFSLA